MRFFLILLFLLSGFAYASCEGTFSDAHKLYLSGNSEAALKLLLCIQRDYPNDLDVKELLSAIYWQRAEEVSYRTTAREILNSSQYHLLPGNNLFHLKRRSSRYLWSLLGASQFLDHSREYDLEASAALNFFTWQVGGAYEKKNRHYKNPSQQINGELLKLFLSSKIYSQLYFDSSFSSRIGSADFLPQYVFSVIPHYELRGLDYSLELKYSHYNENKVVTVVPSLSLFFLENLKGGLFAYFAFSKAESFSLRTNLDYTYKSMEWVLDLSAGRNVEEKGEDAFFRSIALQGKYVVGPGLRVGILSSFFDSSLREEKSVGITLEGAL